MLQLITEISVCLVLVIFLLFMDVLITVGVFILLGIFAIGFMKIFRIRLRDMGLKSRSKLSKIKRQKFLQ